MALSAAVHVALMFATAAGVLRYMAISGRRAGISELFLELGNTGTCHEAWRSGTRVCVPDLTAHDGQWPDLADLARASGVIGVLALPLRVGDGVAGCLGLPTDDGDAVPVEELALLHHLADAAAVSFMRWSADPLRETDITAHVRSALGKGDRRLGPQACPQSEATSASPKPSTPCTDTAPQRGRDRWTPHARSLSALSRSPSCWVDLPKAPCTRALLPS
ncbi:GAF domain-containing protein [Streptomyces goshikiensis]